MRACVVYAQFFQENLLERHTNTLTLILSTRPADDLSIAEIYP